MAELVIHTSRIQDNIRTLSRFFAEHGVEWSLITKVFSGDKEFLRNVLTEDLIQDIGSIGDSRLTSLKNLREVNPAMKTIYIKPPAKVYAEEVVAYADISLNSSYSTILALNDAAKKAHKKHQVIIMIEMGELREGVIPEDVLPFYEKVLALPWIDVIGIGSNLGCMYGVEPTYEKLAQLARYQALLQKRFGQALPYISGGTSITLPLLDQGKVPAAINHFRIGEAAFFGLSPLNNKPFNGLHTDTFALQGNIIELEEKQLVPDGTIGDANIGHTASIKTEASGETSHKAILDFGMLDVDKADIEAPSGDLTFVGVTSDMLVVDLGSNRDQEGKKRYDAGDKIRFAPNYMAVARLLHSKFIDRIYV